MEPGRDRDQGGPRPTRREARRLGRAHPAGRPPDLGRFLTLAGQLSGIGEASIVERPNWNALSDMVGDLRRATAAIPDTQKRMLKVTGEAWSGARTIRGVVGPRGHLLDLEIEPRVFRHPDSKALAANIVATVRLAVEDA